MSIQAMKQALEALLESIVSPYSHEANGRRTNAITALRAAITEAERQEPVAAIRTWHKGTDQHCELINWLDALDDVADGEHDLYTTPQPAIPEWQPIDVPLYYKTRCADGTIFLNAVQMPAHAVEWCIAAAPKPENSHD